MLEHTIEAVVTGWYVAIWEPAPKTEFRQQPFLFKVQRTFSSESEAIAFLNEHYQFGAAA